MGILYHKARENLSLLHQKIRRVFTDGLFKQLFPEPSLICGKSAHGYEM
ncbi:MAG: hypothetical protein LBT20_00305 [Clostridiales bacterium]|jgi:hypothetical protein|nr:hypothetical protein [Clostridiales bacterium]